MARTAQLMIDRAAKESSMSMGRLDAQFMIGYLASKLADALNESDAWQVPCVETGNVQTAFVHQGVHLVAEWGMGDDGEIDVAFLWLGSDDILDLLATDTDEVPEWVYDAIDRDNAELRTDMQLHIAGVV